MDLGAGVGSVEWVMGYGRGLGLGVGGFDGGGR